MGRTSKLAVKEYDCINANEFLMLQDDCVVTDGGEIENCGEIDNGGEIKIGRGVFFWPSWGTSVFFWPSWGTTRPKKCWPCLCKYVW